MSSLSSVVANSAVLSWAVAVAAFVLKPALWVLSWIPYAVLVLLDRRHRRQSAEMRRSWAHTTVPHVKEIRFPAEFDLSGWHLRCEDGRQRWFYEQQPSDNSTGNKKRKGNNNNNGNGHAKRQSFFERYQLGLEQDPKVSPAADADAALDSGIEFLAELQDADGHFPNDYSGPLFLLPGAVFAAWIVHEGDVNKMFTTEKRSEMLRYIKNVQNDDGGWGMHTEGHSIMFGTVLNYCALRMLGAEASDECARKGQAWLKKNGGAQSVASWGKVWLAVLNLYSWDGLNPVPPEMWLLPSWCPISMGRVWCHSRIVTLPFGYLYGLRFAAKEVPLTHELRQELYPCESYDRMKWSQQRNNVWAGDMYTPHSGFYEFGNIFLLAYERFFRKTSIGETLQKAAIAESYKHIHYDDVSTNFICLGPVNKTLNLVVTWLHNGRNAGHDDVAKHFERLDDYLWVGPEGMRMAGYNGSQLWDTSFAAQALCASGRFLKSPVMQKMLIGAHRYVKVAQVLEDPPNRLEYYRSPTKGCWNFSTREQSWQVSDCTAEGLRVALLLNNLKLLPQGAEFPLNRMHDAVDIILALRSTEYGEDAAWASYEEIRAPKYLELLNCAEVYKDIMIEYEYVECTSSCTQTLCMFRKQYPDYRTTAVNEAINAGIKFIKKRQRADGSWYGSWGVCFTYAAFFAVEALIQAEEPEDSPVYARNRRFLLSVQNSDGGWGEDFNSCVTESYVQNADGSQVVNTAWALMALMADGYQNAGPKVAEAIERGVRFLMSRQLANGDWKQERISGVFNGNCAIHYASYKNVMPVWALAKYTALRRSAQQRR